MKNLGAFFVKQINDPKLTFAAKALQVKIEREYDFENTKIQNLTLQHARVKK